MTGFHRTWNCFTVDASNDMTFVEFKGQASSWSTSSETAIFFPPGSSLLIPTGVNPSPVLGERWQYWIKPTVMDNR